MLNIIEDKISETYKKMGLSQGWSFLYTGRDTFTPHQKLMFVGLNPGGKFIPSESPEAYKEIRCLKDNNFNTYLDEGWADKENDENRGFNPLQEQIHDLYAQLYEQAKVLDLEFQNTYGMCFKSFMRSTLALNYIPFRSKDYNSLNNKAGILEAIDNIWKNDILSHISPSVIIVMGQLANDKLEMFLKEKYFEKNKDVFKTGWGETTYSLTYFTTDKGEILLAKCPHLSRYKLFNNTTEKFKDGREQFISAIAEALSQK